MLPSHSELILEVRSQSYFLLCIGSGLGGPDQGTFAAEMNKRSIIIRVNQRTAGFVDGARLVVQPATLIGLYLLLVFVPQPKVMLFPPFPLRQYAGSAIGHCRQGLILPYSIVSVGSPRSTVSGRTVTYDVFRAQPARGGHPLTRRHSLVAASTGFKAL